MSEDLERRDRAIINAFQGGFPVSERPFAVAAEALQAHQIDVSADELLDRIRQLDETDTLTRFGPLINAEEIGGTATLVALHAPEDRFDEIADQVNAHEEVAHNYEREHPVLNMWFVVSVADPDRVDEVLAAIEAETGQETYNMPKQQEFRVEAKFYVDGPLSDGGLDLSDRGPKVTRETTDGLTEDEVDLVLAIQDGVPLTQTPYEDVAADISADPDWVRTTMKRFDESGKIRRIGVIPNHYALGYTENGMTVWNVPDEKLDVVGPEIASLEFVTHCYHRPRHESVWPYNFFAMTHGRTEAESERRIQEVRDRMAEFWDVTEADWDSLFSTQILKKTGIRLDERAREQH
jgi:DNA-binding Lrp family transcriptional regulator